MKYYAANNNRKVVHLVIDFYVKIQTLSLCFLVQK